MTMSISTGASNSDLPLSLCLEYSSVTLLDTISWLVVTDSSSGPLGKKDVKT